MGYVSSGANKKKTSSIEDRNRYYPYLQLSNALIAHVTSDEC
jgi:hypothetical protein